MGGRNQDWSRTGTDSQAAYRSRSRCRRLDEDDDDEGEERSDGESSVRLRNLGRHTPSMHSASTTISVFTPPPTPAVEAMVTLVQAGMQRRSTAHCAPKKPS
jgi:hypothetical protein